MKNGFRRRHKPMLKALKMAGLKVDDVETQDNKTVITVTPNEQNAGRGSKSKE